MMSATIMFDWIPRLQGSSSAEPTLACSVTSGRSLLSSNSSAVSDPSIPEPYQHTRVESNLVDYVFVLDLAADDPLQKVTEELLLREMHLHIVQDVAKGLPPHLNQTAYKAVWNSLIAVSIEAKYGTVSGDPLARLGIWVAAWHIRMKKLRFDRGLQVLSIPTTVASITEPSSVAPLHPARLVSLPLILTDGATWQIYYACDCGDHIEISGPFQLGSTLTLASTYQLLACLRAIKEWVKVTFYKEMRRWFHCNEE